MKLPLNDLLGLHAEDISFHTPAHNGGILNGALAAAKFDITELPYSDNLLFPEGVIAESEELVSEAYGFCGKSVYSTAGATALIHAAIYARAPYGAVLVYGNAHRSVYSALRRAGAGAFRYSGGDLGGALRSSKAATLVITSPDYYGNELPLDKIKEISARSGADVIVDASHGAHFAFSPKLPDSATLYFDTVIHSAHKTLPVLTGGAVAHIGKDKEEEFMRAFRDVHTTSPSYPVMASTEWAVAYMKVNGERLYEETLDEIARFKEKTRLLPIEVKETDDPTRLVIYSAEAESICLRLAESGVYAECADGEKATFIVTPFNARELKRVAEILGAFPFGRTKAPRPTPVAAEGLTELTFGTVAERVSVRESAGRILYEGVGVYPPGAPVLLPGEYITPEKRDILLELCARDDLSLVGLEKGGVLVLK